MMSKKWLMAFAVAVSLVLGGCSEDGGDDNNNGGDTSGLSDTSGSTSGDTSGSTSGSTSGDTSGSTSGDTSGVTEGCGDVTTQGSCEGDLLTYCGEDDNGDPEVVTLDCAEGGATCATINAEYGVDCVYPVANECDAVDGTFCGGTNPVCIEDADGNATCQENSALTCDPAQTVGACQDDIAVFGCLEGHTVLARDCGVANKTCDVVNAEYGADCFAATDAACIPYYDFCAGTNAGCVEGANDTATCKANLTTACVSATEDVEFVPVCEGDVVVYDCLLDHTLIGTDCAAIGGTCAEIDPQIGADCLVPPGGDCESANFCGGTNPACQIGVTAGALTYTCVEAAADLCAAAEPCMNDVLILDCTAEHTASTLDCTALGATCDGTAGACVGVTAGNFCEPGLADCATGLTCTPPATEDGLATCAAP